VVVRRFSRRRLISLGAFALTAAACGGVASPTQPISAPTATAAAPLLLPGLTSAQATVLAPVEPSPTPPLSTSEQSPLITTGASPLVAPASGGERQLVIVHTNSVNGYVDPCG
jgi:hypothetical protein